MDAVKLEARKAHGFRNPATPAAPRQDRMHPRCESWLEPEQVEELLEHALRLVTATLRRFKVLRTFDGPGTNLGARARQVMRAGFGESDSCASLATSTRRG